MRSQNTTNYSNNNLTSQEICAIIKICGESGVKEISYKDLHASFAGLHPSDKDMTIHSPGQVWNSLEDKKNLAQAELNLMDDHLAEIQLTDPLRFEELLANQDLNK